MIENIETAANRLIEQKPAESFKGLAEKSISIVVPTFNAELSLIELYSRICKTIELLKYRYQAEIIFVNDGSQDNTLSILEKLLQQDSRIKIINLSRNFGNQIAITAGLDKACGDAVVVIDDDLQDPPEVILGMVSVWEKGFDVVYGVRKKQRGISKIFKYVTKSFYKFINYISEVKIPTDTGDFRLMDRRVVEQLRGFKETHRYLRGMVAWVGFKQYGLLYDRDPRNTGESSFTLKKYIDFALDGIIGFSTRPLYFICYLGLILIFLSPLALLFKSVFPFVFVLISGVQLCAMGLLGLYIARIHNQSKNRPLYIVEKEYNFKSEPV